MTLSVQRKLVLGLQHTVAMFGATVLVPLLTGLDPSVALFGAGLATLLFHALTGFGVPTFLGSSFAFIAPGGEGACATRAVFEVLRQCSLTCKGSHPRKFIPGPCLTGLLLQ